MSEKEAVTVAEQARRWREAFDRDTKQMEGPVGPPPPRVRGVHPLSYHLGQLRHLYAQMVTGGVQDCAAAAKGLLGPAIQALELHLQKEADR